jgi:hypothetical protein
VPVFTAVGDIFLVMVERSRLFPANPDHDAPPPAEASLRSWGRGRWLLGHVIWKGSLNESLRLTDDLLSSPLVSVDRSLQHGLILARRVYEYPPTRADPKKAQPIAAVKQTLLGHDSVPDGFLSLMKGCPRSGGSGDRVAFSVIIAHREYHAKSSENNLTGRPLMEAEQRALAALREPSYRVQCWRPRPRPVRAHHRRRPQ